MIWLKRVLPFLLIVAAWQGYAVYQNRKAARQEESDRLKAEVTARIWVASAKYRYEPARFVSFRDSILRAEGISAEEMFSLIDRVNNDPEHLLPYTRAMLDFVDSFSRLEDSLSRIDSAGTDSTDPG